MRFINNFLLKLCRIWDTMDPFSALSISTSAIQIIDFGSKIIRGVYNIYKKGSVECTDNLLSDSDGLKNLTKNLRTALNAHELFTDLADDERVSYAVVPLDLKNVAAN